MASYVAAWLTAFVFTQAFEVPIYRFALPCSALAAFVPTLLTHPIVWFVIFPRLHASYLTKLWIAEVFAVLAEALVCLVLLRRSGGRGETTMGRGLRRVSARAVIVATCANVTSLSLGLASRRLFGIP